MNEPLEQEELPEEPEVAKAEKSLVISVELHSGHWSTLVSSELRTSFSKTSPQLMHRNSYKGIPSSPPDFPPVKSWRTGEIRPDLERTIRCTVC